MNHLSTRLEASSVCRMQSPLAGDSPWFDKVSQRWFYQLDVSIIHWLSDVVNQNATTGSAAFVTDNPESKNAMLDPEPRTPRLGA